ncbi:hypothetical protein KC330_g24 [Hortaea werneckii]|nr:hypothetical protein KC330_g24 [Hortaea werneckii]
MYWLAIFQSSFRVEHERTGTFTIQPEEMQAAQGRSKAAWSLFNDAAGPKAERPDHRRCTIPMRVSDVYNGALDFGSAWPPRVTVDAKLQSFKLMAAREDIEPTLPCSMLAVLLIRQ